MSYDSEVAVDSPVLRCRMDDTGATCVDTGSGGNDGTYQNTPTLSQTGAIYGDSDDSVLFARASSEYVSFGNPAELQITGNLTIECWIKRGATQSQNMVIIGKDDSTNRCYSLQFDSSNNLQFVIFKSDALTSINGGTITDQDWHHIVAVNDGTDLLLYTDGAMTGYGSGDGGTIDNDAANFTFCRRDDATDYFDGTFDEGAIYNSALSADRALRHYVSGLINHGTRSTLASLPILLCLFSEGGGTVCQDYGSGANPGTYQATPTLTGISNPWQRDTGLSASFASASSEYVNDFGNPANLQFTGTFTLESWFKTGTSGATQVICAKDDVATNRCYSLSINTSDEVAFGIYESNVLAEVTSNSTVADDKWHHVVAIHDGIDLKLYLDGSINGMNYGGGGTVDNDAASFEIGRTGNGASYFDGELALVAAYGSTLTHASVINHYRDGRPLHSDVIMSESPTGYWLMNEVTGSTAKDLTGKGYDGAIQNEPTLGVAGPIEEEAGLTAIDFDSVDQHIIIPDAFAFTFGNGATDSAFTISAWVRANAGTNEIILGKFNPSGEREYIFRLNSDNLLMSTYDASNGAAASRTSDSTVTNIYGVWTHVAMTYDGTGGASAANGITLYIDGEVVASTPSTGGSYVAMENQGADVQIGHYETSADYYDGSIAGVSVLAGEKTAAFMQSVFRSGLPKQARVMHDFSPVLNIRNNEITGTIARDHSGYHNHGTHVASPTLGEVGPVIGDTSNSGAFAVDYNGSTQCTTIVGDTSVSFGDGSTDSPMTLLAWVYMDDATNFSICSKYGVPTGTGEFLWYSSATDDYRLLLRDESASAQPFRTADATITSLEGGWVLLGATYDGGGGATAASGITLYINGEVVASTATEAGSYVAMEDTAEPVTIGCHTQSGPTTTYYANGKIAEVVMIPAELSAGSMRMAYEISLSRYARELMNYQPVIFWRHSAPSGTTEVDLSGNNHDGTYAGTPTLGATGLVPSDSDTAVTFDGVDDECSVASNADYNDLFEATGGVGGTLVQFVSVAGVGEAGEGVLIGKHTNTGNKGWSLNVNAIASSDVQLEFHHEFTPTEGDWVTATDALTLNANHQITMCYNSADTSAAPVMMIDGEPANLTEASSPSGSSNSDSGVDFVVGNDDASDFAFDGTLDDSVLFQTRLATEKRYYMWVASQLTGIEFTENVVEALSSLSLIQTPFPVLNSVTETVDLTETVTRSFGRDIVETLALLDALGLFQMIYESISAQTVVNVVVNIVRNIAESIASSNTIVLEQATVIHEAIALAAVDSTNIIANNSITETLSLESLIMVVWDLAITESVNATDTVTPDSQKYAAIAELLVVSGAVETIHNANIVVSAAIAVEAVATRGFTKDIIENATASNTILTTWYANYTALETLTLSSATTASITAVSLVNESVALTDAVTLQAIMSSTITEEITTYVTIRIGENEYIAWVSNADTLAVGQFTEYPFNSFAQVGDQYFGCADGGIYELTGDDDDGTDIDAKIRVGLSNFGSPKLKRPPKMYLGYTSDGSLVLKVIESSREGKFEHWYEMTETGGNFHEARIPIGKGMRAVYYGWELINKEGADFEIDEMRLLVSQVKRRV